MMPKKQLTDCVWLPGEHLNRLECSRPTWCLDTAVKSTKVKLHDSNIRDIIITHVISLDTQTNKQTNKPNKQMQKHKAIL